ncbi:Fic family protein [Boudabousia marimammalium]|uniref:Addiction module protein n=1 Tax=Boudabousia marimammalium TaxID=156892 RepID=A0A1Q5PL50_9ACTO|nr:Fic family protein [Boudabousia marimammalium]OKL47365.1 addiction module protein [Boudabousia marimammalium]
MWNGPESPYQELPGLPPAVDLATPRILSALIEPRAALAALNQACKQLPNPALLINLIPLLEAQSSSEIENIVTTRDELFRAANLEELSQISPAAREALRYRAALRAGFESILDRPLTARTAAHVCSEILGREVQVRSGTGTYIGNARTQKRIYTPPEGKGVLESKLSDWEKFIHQSEELDPLIVMALAHYQFEAIHPFSDGNGRTGRILNLLALKELSLLDMPVLYLSGYLVRHKNDYYRLLSAVTAEQKWEEWLVYMFKAVEQTAKWTLQLIEELLELQENFEQKIREYDSSLPAADLTKLAFTQPYLRASTVMDYCGVSRPTATKRLKSLATAGVLTSEKMGRNTIYLNQSLLQLVFSTSVD